MKRNVRSYESWWNKLTEKEDSFNPDKEFGDEGGGSLKMMMVEGARFKKGKFVSGERFWAAKGETRASGDMNRYDYHVFYSPNEYDGWENLPEFQQYDTRGMRYSWSELSKGLPVVIMTDGTGNIHHHKSSEHIAYEGLFRKLIRIPEYVEILRSNAKKSSSIPDSVMMSLKSKLAEIKFEEISSDIFDECDEDPKFIKDMVKKSVLMGL
jgi:hypothetical protein